MKIAGTYQAVHTFAFSPRRACKGLIEMRQYDGPSGYSLWVAFELSTGKLQLGLLDFLPAQLVSIDPGVWLRDGLVRTPLRHGSKWVQFCYRASFSLLPSAGERLADIHSSTDTKDVTPQYAKEHCLGELLTVLL